MKHKRARYPKTKTRPTAYFEPVYVGKVSHLERKVSEGVGLVEASKAVRQLAPHWKKPNLDYFARILAKYASQMRQGDPRQ